ncbi:MAG: peptidoglycan-binding protein [Rhodobacteraceae bacterium]|nr:peptidoglycan-binding protein [Paracoccaceae bacterium]
MDRARQTYDGAATGPVAVQCVRELLGEITRTQPESDIAVGIMLGEPVAGLDVAAIEAQAGIIGVETAPPVDPEGDFTAMSNADLALLFAAENRAAFVDLCVELTPDLTTDVAATLLQTVADFGLRETASTVWAEGFDALSGIARSQDLGTAGAATVANVIFEALTIEVLDGYAALSGAEVDSERLVSIASPTAQLIVAAATSSGPAAPALLAGSTAFFEARGAALSSYGEDAEFAVVARNLISADAYRRAAVQLRAEGKPDRAAEINALADSVVASAAEAAAEVFAGSDGPVAASMLRDMDNVIQLFRSGSETEAREKLRAIQVTADENATSLFSPTFNNFYERFFMIGPQHRADSVRAYLELDSVLREVFVHAPLEPSPTIANGAPETGADANAGTTAADSRGSGPEWVVLETPHLIVRPGSSNAGLSVAPDGSASYLNARLFPPGADPDATEVRLYRSPRATRALLLQWDADFGGQRLALVDLGKAQVIRSDFVPETAVRGLGTPSDVRIPMLPIAWSSDGRIAALPLSAQEWQADLLLIHAATGASVVRGPSDMPLQKKGSPDIATLQWDSEDAVSVTYDLITCADTDCSAPRRDGTLRVRHPLPDPNGAGEGGGLAGGRGGALADKAAGDWGPGLVAGVDLGYLPCRDAAQTDPACLTGLGLSEEAAAFSHAIAGDYSGFATGSDFRETGDVDLAHAELLGASVFMTPVLLNGPVGLHQVAFTRDLRANFRDTASQRMLDRYPNATSAVAMTIGAHRKLPDGTQRFVLTEAISDGCRACAGLGTAVTFLEIGPSTGNVPLRRPVGLLLDAATAEDSVSAEMLLARPDRLQAMLNRLGYDAGEMDGYPGPKTRTALMAFQAEACLAATGQPDPATTAALIAADGFAAPCAGAVPPDGISANTPLLSGIYVDDPAKCGLDALPFENVHLSQRIVRDGTITWGQEGGCEIERTDIVEGVTLFRGSCFEGNSQSPARWRFDIQANDRFVDLGFENRPGDIRPFARCHANSRLRQAWASWFPDDATGPTPAASDAPVASGEPRTATAEAAAAWRHQEMASFQLRPGEARDGFLLSADGSASFAGAALFPPWHGTPEPDAYRLIVFGSDDGQRAVAMFLSGFPGAQAIGVVDLAARRVLNAGIRPEWRYGPDAALSWSPDGRYAALTMPLAEFSQGLGFVELATGHFALVPEGAFDANAMVQLDRLSLETDSDGYAYAVARAADARAGSGTASPDPMKVSLEDVFRGYRSAGGSEAGTGTSAGTDPQTDTGTEPQTDTTVAAPGAAGDGRTTAEAAFRQVVDRAFGSSHRLSIEESREAGDAAFFSARVEILEQEVAAPRSFGQVAPVMVPATPPPAISEVPLFEVILKRQDGVWHVAQSRADPQDGWWQRFCPQFEDLFAEACTDRAVPATPAFEWPEIPKKLDREPVASGDKQLDEFLATTLPDWLVPSQVDYRIFPKDDGGRISVAGELMLVAPTIEMVPGIPSLRQAARAKGLLNDGFLLQALAELYERPQPDRTNANHLQEYRVVLPAGTKILFDAELPYIETVREKKVSGTLNYVAPEGMPIAELPVQSYLPGDARSREVAAASIAQATELQQHALETIVEFAGYARGGLRLATAKGDPTFDLLLDQGVAMDEILSQTRWSGGRAFGMAHAGQFAINWPGRADVRRSVNYSNPLVEGQTLRAILSLYFPAEGVGLENTSLTLYVIRDGSPQAVADRLRWDSDLAEGGVFVEKNITSLGMVAWPY